MGFTNVMKLQENPDGIEGHEERVAMQDASKRFPPKRKYTGNYDERVHHYSEQTKKERVLSIKQIMKQTCESYIDKCRPGNCCFCVHYINNAQEVIDKAKRIIEEYEKSEVKL